MELPIFPLNGAVLFPGTSLPLNIFEQRYIEMINYSFARDRYVGMIQKNSNDELYKVGCVGKIHSFNETADGRYLISLQGTNCFKIIRELNQGFTFRIVEAKLIESNENTNKLKDLQKLKLLKLYKNYIKLKNINLDTKELEKIEIDQIIKFVAMVSPFTDADKQVLLETSDLFDFYNRLSSIIELELMGDFTNKTIN